MLANDTKDGRDGFHTRALTAVLAPGYYSGMLPGSKKTSDLTTPHRIVYCVSASINCVVSEVVSGRRGLPRVPGSIPTKPLFLSSRVSFLGRGDPPPEGVDGLPIPGYTGAIGSESQPMPSGGGLLSATAVALDTPATPFNPLKTPREHHFAHQGLHSQTLKPDRSPNSSQASDQLICREVDLYQPLQSKSRGLIQQLNSRLPLVPEQKGRTSSRIEETLVSSINTRRPNLHTISCVTCPGVR